MPLFKILDGAMGSELIKRGLAFKDSIWLADANIENQTMVKQIHQEYISAGADYITTNTFRSTPRSYLKTGIGERSSIEKAKDSFISGVKLAQEVACSSVKIIGSIAPLEDCYAPELFPGRDIAIIEFLQLGEWFLEAGIDILMLETMNSIAETASALSVLQHFKFSIWVSFVLKDDTCLLSGDSLYDAINLLNDYKVDKVLLNCNPLDRTIVAVDNVVDNWAGEWGIYPNLGIGEPSNNGNVIKHETMAKYISTIEKAVYLGASVIGACCGSSPIHIAQTKKLHHDLSN